MTNITPPTASPSTPTPRRSKSRKTDTTGARALLAALAMSATLGGWALIAKDSQSVAANVADPAANYIAAIPASNSPQLTPLPTVIAPLAGLDQIAATQLAPMIAPTLQQAPLPSASRLAMLRPLARSRSSN